MSGIRVSPNSKGEKKGVKELATERGGNHPDRGNVGNMLKKEKKDYLGGFKRKAYGGRGGDANWNYTSKKWVTTFFQREKGLAQVGG